MKTYPRNFIISHRDRFEKLYIKEGDILCKLGQWDAAIRSYNDALRLNAENPEAHYGISMAYLSTERFDQAATYAKKAIELGPYSYQNYSIYAAAMLALGKPEVAIDALLNAIKQKWNFLQAHKLLAKLFSMRTLANPQRAEYHTKMAEIIWRNKQTIKKNSLSRRKRWTHKNVHSNRSTNLQHLTRSRIGI